MEIRLSKRVQFILYLLVWAFRQSNWYNVIKYLNLAGYDKEIPPNTSDITQINYDLSITQFASVDELTMTTNQIIVEHFVWTDTRLAYENNSQFDDLHKSTFLSLTANITNVWLPETMYTNLVDHEWKDQALILYPNGTLFYSTYRWVVLLWEMDFKMLPFDNNEWIFTAYLVNQEADTAVLQPNPWNVYSEASEPGAGFVPQHTLANNVFDIASGPVLEQNVYLESSGQYHSGLTYTFSLDRRAGYFVISYVVPSLLTVFLAYSSFWIDKAGVPARVSLPITTVLIMLSLMTRANRNVPAVSYITWMAKFFFGTLIFWSYSMIEYGALNFCFTQYVQLRKEINDLISNLRKIQIKRKFFTL